MILGLDISFTYPYIAILVVIVALIVLWRLWLYVANATSVLTALVSQVGTNGKSTLRAELTALAKRTEEVQTLLLEKSELDKKAAATQADAMAAQDKAIETLRGLIRVLGETMGSIGLNNQIRSLLEAYVQKDIATTNLNVIQAGQDSRLGQAAAGTGVDQNILKAGDKVVIDKVKE